MARKGSKPLAGPVVGRIGENVKRERGTRSQSSVAAAAGMDQSTLSRIEKGNYASLDLEAVVRLTLALECDIYDLLDGLGMAMTVVSYEAERAA